MCVCVCEDSLGKPKVKWRVSFDEMLLFFVFFFVSFFTSRIKLSSHFHLREHELPRMKLRAIFG